MSDDMRVLYKMLDLFHNHHNEIKYDFMQTLDEEVRDEFAGYFDEWAKSLNVDKLSRYCASVTNLFEHFLLCASKKDTNYAEISGCLYKELDSFCEFKVRPQVGSIIEEDNINKDEDFVLSGFSIAKHISLHSGEEFYHGLFAWHLITSCLFLNKFDPEEILLGLKMELKTSTIKFAQFKINIDSSKYDDLKNIGGDEA